MIPAPAGSRFPHLAVQGGKDAKLRLVNLDNLSSGALPAVSGRLGGEIGSIVNVPQGGQVFAQPAVWINPADDTRWVFVATAGGVSGLQLHLDGAGNPSLVSKWTVPQGGTSPVVANNVLYYAGGSALRALDPVTGNVLWTSTNGEVGPIHWQSPIVFNGAVYVTDQSNHLVAYAPTTRAASAGFDVDADGKADIAWINTAGRTALWKMDGAAVTAASLIMPDANWRLAAYSDFNGDGKSDFVWKNQTTGATAIWLIGRQREPPRAAVIAFEVIGLSLLFAVATIAVLSAPLPLRQYTNDPPLVLGMHFPYAWIVSVCVAGALFVPVVGIISPALLGVVPSLELVVAVAVGGRFALAGAVLGAVVMGYARTYFSEELPDAWLYLQGALFVLVMTLAPKGIAGLAAGLVRRREARA